MDPIILKFKQPILVDGQTYTECDMTGMRNLTTRQMYAAQLQNGLSLSTSHMEAQNLRYAITVASAATGLPRGFFGQLKRTDALGFPREINNLLDAMTEEFVTMKGKKIQFSKTVEGLGRTLDLSGLDTLVAEDYATAQDEIGIEESTTISDIASVKYTCALAALVTEKPLDVFMDAPAWVGIAVRGVVTGHFFEQDSAELVQDTDAEDGSEKSGSAMS